MHARGLPLLIIQISSNFGDRCQANDLMVIGRYLKDTQILLFGIILLIKLKGTSFKCGCKLLNLLVPGSNKDRIKKARLEGSQERRS